MPVRFRRVLAVLGCLAIVAAGDLLSPSVVLAQKPTFDVEGVITDAQQAVLPGATVTLQNAATGLVRNVVSDQSGRYVVTALPPEGQYSIKVEVPGFTTEVRSGLVFNAGQKSVINFTLKLSTVQETVTVAGATPLV